MTFREDAAFTVPARALLIKYWSRKTTAKHLLAFARKHDELFFRADKVGLFHSPCTSSSG